VTLTKKLEKLQRLINNFPSKSSDVRFQKEIFDEIFGILGELNRSKASAKAFGELRKEVEALKTA